MGICGLNNFASRMKTIFFKSLQWELSWLYTKIVFGFDISPAELHPEENLHQICDLKTQLIYKTQFTGFEDGIHGIIDL